MFTSLCPLWPWPLTSKINRAHPLTIVNISEKFDQEAHNGLVSSCSHAYFHSCQLWPWPLTSKINRVHPLTMANMSAKFDEEVQRFSLNRNHKRISIYVNCDLWPPNSIGVHPLVIVNVSTKYDDEAHNGLVSIAFTRSKRDEQTHVTTAALLYPLRNTLPGDNYQLNIINGVQENEQSTKSVYVHWSMM